MAGTNRTVRGQTKSVDNDLASWLSDPVSSVGTVLVLSISALMLIVGMGLTGNESLLGYWQANEDANDSAGANHGIMAGGATFGTGHDGQAFSLDGANAHVSVPTFPAGISRKETSPSQPGLYLMPLRPRNTMP